MAGFVRECHNCTPQTCNEYESCEDRKAREDWHGKMTAKSAWKLGYITREQFEEIRKAFKEKHPNGGDFQ
jgi:hypothetical protein